MATIKVNKRGKRLFRQNDDGTETEMPVPLRVVKMTDAEIHAAALTDPDNPPSSPDDPPRKQRPRSFIIRRARKLTQEQFAAIYKLDLDIVRLWETGELEPDRAAKTLLWLIANDPEGIASMLSGHPRKEAAE